MSRDGTSASRNAPLVGTLLVLGYCVINSTKSVFEGSLVQHLSPEFIAFNSFVLAQGFYFMICRDKAALLATVRRCLPDVIALNVATMVSWVAVLYAFTVFEPAMANSVILGLVPSITIALGFKLRPGVRALRLEVVAALGMLAAMSFLVAAAWNGSSAIGDLPKDDLAAGLIYCVLTSFALSAITYFTRRLGDQGMSVQQMMASRFGVLILVTLGLLIGRDSFDAYTPRNIGAILLISIVGVIVSLYLLQAGMVRTEPITVSMLFGTNLIITYVVQFLDPRLHQSTTTFVGVLVLSAAMCLGAWARWRDGRDNPPAGVPDKVPAEVPAEAEGTTQNVGNRT
ncbi:EamA/RhaT family transporter [Micromonospora sp. WMMA1363]|uniref:EamA family transporter n=1 Tax=Micromonospora sp. WMMA1363 TaxID=3053985 RepID=UPI00259D2CF1|nr:EamA family transporter [Micromonospora sp. WMMA1363]MDM4721535.1 EamA/RhaT family transporter [Micromonospora sp. WMMA1363]